MPKSEPSSSKNFENLFEYEAFIKILRYYVDLNCFVIAWDPKTGTRDWMAVHYHQRLASLYDFQKKYEFKFDFEKFTNPAQGFKPKPGELLLQESLGFYDTFMPILRDGKRIGTLLSGAFSDRELTYPHLKESWKKLTKAAETSGEDMDFRQFVKVIAGNARAGGAGAGGLSRGFGAFRPDLGTGPRSPNFRTASRIIDGGFLQEIFPQLLDGLGLRPADPAGHSFVESGSGEVGLGTPGYRDQPYSHYGHYGGS